MLGVDADGNKLPDIRRPLPPLLGPSSVETAKGAFSASTSKPVKAVANTTGRITGVMGDKAKARSQKIIDNIDTELCQYLRTEALFRPRTPELILILKGKAMRFLDTYDLSHTVTPSMRYLWIIAALKVAMLISPEEDSFRQCLKDHDQEELRKKTTLLHKEGVVGKHFDISHPFSGLHKVRMDK